MVQPLGWRRAFPIRLAGSAGHQAAVWDGLDATGTHRRCNPRCALRHSIWHAASSRSVRLGLSVAAVILASKRLRPD